MRLAPLIMAGVAAAAAVGGIGLLAPSPRRAQHRRVRSSPNTKARLIGGVILLAIAAILTIFALTLDTL